MRLAPLVFLFLTGCATSTTVTLPLHEAKISVPHSLSREYVSTYTVGYENGWMSTLQIFAEDIDHKGTFMEDVSTGDPNFLAGWIAAREDAEAMIRGLVALHGKEGAQAQLREAIRSETRPNHRDRKKGSIRKSQKPLDSAGHRESQHPVETLRSGPQPGKDWPLRRHEQLKSGPKAATTRSKRPEWPVQKRTLPSRVPSQKSRSQPSNRNDRSKTSTPKPFPTVLLAGK
jgi:hypothetical protein